MERGLNSWIDLTVIGIYFLFVIGVGLLSMCRKNRESVKGYFLAGRTMHWIPIGASLFASNIGSEHFVGLAGSGAASGIAVVAFEWGAVILLVLLGWFFLPVYLTAQVFTIPEYLGRRFGGYRMRIYLSSVALSLYVLTKVSVDVYAGGVFIQQATGWNLYLSMIPLLFLTALYTIAGGLAAVVFTDALQTAVMMTGAVILAAMCYVKVGGLEALYYKYMHAVPSTTLATSFPDHTILNVSTIANAINGSYNDSGSVISNHSHTSQCGLPRHDAFHIFRDPVHSDLPWPGVMVRATLASLWNWCADQVIVQRALAARNMAHAQASTLMAGFLKLTPLFLIIIPGMISRVLYPDMVACADRDTCMDVCNNPSGCSNVAYPLLILRMSPTGMRGLLMAVMVAALMSSLTSIFNSAGTIFTMDIWRKIRPQASEKQLLLVGRLFVVVLVIVSVAWIPLIVGSQEGQLFMYIQAVTGYIAPPICSIFLLAIFVPRINERGAFWGVLAGQATGATRLVLDFVYPAPGCGHQDTRPLLVSKVHFTYFSIIVLGVTALVAIIVSLTKPPQDPQEIEGLTWWSLSRQRRRAIRKNNDAKAVLKNSEEGIEMKQDDRSRTTEATTGNSDNPQTFDSVVPPPWCHILNGGALFLLAVVGFLFGFFA